MILHLVSGVELLLSQGGMGVVAGFLARGVWGLCGILSGGLGLK